MCKGQQPYFVQRDCVLCTEIVTNSHLVVCDDATVLLAPGDSIQTVQPHMVLPSLPYQRGSKSWIVKMYLSLKGIAAGKKKKRYVRLLLLFSYFSRRIRPCKPITVCWTGGGCLTFIDKHRYNRISTSWKERHSLIWFWYGFEILNFLQDEPRREVERI